MKYLILLLFLTGCTSDKFNVGDCISPNYKDFYIDKYKILEVGEHEYLIERIECPDIPILVGNTRTLDISSSHLYKKVICGNYK
jgi:hypothetical protein